VAKTVYSPIRVKNDPPVYYLIDCSSTGFQTLKFVYVNKVSEPVWRCVPLTVPKQSLANAQAAFNKAFGEHDHGEIGELPPSSTNYSEAEIISFAQAEALEATRVEAVAVGDVFDPRKEKKAQREAEKRTREQREIARGFLVAFNDSTASWTESRSDAYRLIKGTTLSLTPVDMRHNTLTEPERDEKAKILAYELGGTFSLTGFFGEDDAFVITSQTANDEALERRIMRARPGHLRRARLYRSTDERAAAVRDLLSGKTESTIHVTCHHRNAICYADTIVDRDTLKTILPLLDAEERTLFDARVAHATV
jgi:hypothetical protein